MYVCMHVHACMHACKHEDVDIVGEQELALRMLRLQRVDGGRLHELAGVYKKCVSRPVLHVWLHFDIY